MVLLTIAMVVAPCVAGDQLAVLGQDLSWWVIAMVSGSLRVLCWDLGSRFTNVIVLAGLGIASWDYKAALLLPQ